MTLKKDNVDSSKINNTYKTTYVKDKNGNAILVESLPAEIQTEVNKIDMMKYKASQMQLDMEILMCAVNFKTMQISSMIEKIKGGDVDD